MSCPPWRTSPTARRGATMSDIAIPRSRIRNWILSEDTKNARVIVVKPRDFKPWLERLEARRVEVEKQLTDAGFVIEDS